jgi:hypothetical protein
MDVRNFRIFADEVKYWIIKFGLFDYETRVTTNEDEHVRGTCVTYSSNVDRVADISVQKDWKKPEHQDLCRVAFHEVCELLLRDMYNVGAEYVVDHVMATELHRIIRRLENSYFSEDYRSRIKGGIKGYVKQTRHQISSSRTKGAEVALVCVDALTGATNRHATGHSRRSPGSRQGRPGV